MVRGRPKRKFGKRINFYLSNEVITKMNDINAKNKTFLIEELIRRKWDEEKKMARLQ